MARMTRRECLQLAAIPFLGSWLRPGWIAAAPAAPAASATPKSVAAVVTVYKHNSHADVILTKILKGWKHDGGPGPALKLAGLYVDQISKGDLARQLCEEHGVPLFDSIEKAVTVGSDRIPVDGVLSIGEHGDYPFNEAGQHLYPRRRFFAEIAATFEKYGRVVPVFNDKHLGPLWDDAKWMYDRARELKIPFMAGSSLPVGHRRTEIDVPLGSEIEAAVGVGYGGVESYGFHALEYFQCFVERRRQAERGVKQVRFLEGAEMWAAVDSGLVSKSVLEAAVAVVPQVKNFDMRRDPQSGVYLFEYVDGFRGAVFMLRGLLGTGVAVKLKGEPQPIASDFDQRDEPRFPHFAYLLKAIERMVHTGQPSYPVERTLLTSGILDRGMNSRARKGELLETPELAIAYRPVDYPCAQHVDLQAPPAG